MIPSDPLPLSGALPVHHLLTRLWERRGDVLFVMLLAAGLGLAFAFVMPPEYTSTSQIVLENFETKFEKTDQADATSRSIDEADIATQVEILRSYDIANRVLKKKNLFERNDFVPLNNHTLVTQFMATLGARPLKETEHVSQEKRRKKIFETYFSGLKVYSAAKSKVIFIEFKAHTPGLSAEIAQTIAETFVDYTKELQSESTGRARHWLATQIETLRKKVVETEVAAEEFRAKEDLLKGETSTLSAQKISELNHQLTLAHIERTQAEAKYQSLQTLMGKKEFLDSSLSGMDSPFMQRLKEQKAFLDQKFAELSTIYLERHPKIQSLQKEQASIAIQMDHEAQKMFQRLKEEVKQADQKVSSLEKDLGSLKTQTSSSNVADVKLRALEREAAANRSLLETFLKQYSEASTKEAMSNQPALARIISAAEIPLDPSFPLFGPILALSLFMGFLLSLVFIFVAEVMKESLRLHHAIPLSSSHHELSHEPS